jgi:hypothetical protein
VTDWAIPFVNSSNLLIITPFDLDLFAVFAFHPLLPEIGSRITRNVEVHFEATLRGQAKGASRDVLRSAESLLQLEVEQGNLENGERPVTPKPSTQLTALYFPFRDMLALVASRIVTAMGPRTWFVAGGGNGGAFQSSPIAANCWRIKRKSQSWITWLPGHTAAKWLPSALNRRCSIML